MIAIINASPLIYLGKIGAVFLLPKLFTQIITTTTVKQEVLRQETEPEYLILKESFDSWLEVRSVQNRQFINQLLQLQLHLGEAEIIALGRELSQLEKKPVIIIDDLHARDVAHSLGLVVTGTIGILLRAVKKKVIDTTIGRSMLELLVSKTTFHLSTQLYAQILRVIEENK